jgi:hypothetical protein
MRHIWLGLRLLVFLTVPCLDVGAAADPAGTQPAGTAFLKIERASSYISSLIDLHAYVNEEYVGSISNGETELFSTKSGLNSLYVRDWTGQRSGIVSFRAEPGAIFTVSCKPRSLWDFVKNLPTVQSYDLAATKDSQPMLVYAVNQTKGEKVDPSGAKEDELTSDTMSVVLNETPKEVQMASEIVRVPEGVSVKITRGRTIDHAVEVAWSGKAEGGLTVGPEFISAEIKAAIEQKHGQTYKESERVEYEIELNGGQNTEYKLVWKDRWLTGTATIKDRTMVEEIPFEFKEWTQLHIQVVK